MKPSVQLEPRVDAYVAKSAGFAQPILRLLPATVHAACPEAEETLKWGFPHFMDGGILCGMSVFKQHCAFGFRHGGAILDKKDNRNTEAMGQFGRIVA
ncbi:MAG TPA: DUF1801 domain-containing protein [Steroidobacteraceae bacterium]|nr:DUF1801 domain-containing protein [Steroidobacteraceae bacterium]